MKKRRPSAFTLVELLVVVAVMMILATLLSPFVAKAREHAYRVICMSHLRQAYACNMAYASDHDGQFPGYVASDAQDGGCGIKHYSVTKWGLLYPQYLKDIRILFCPSRKPGRLPRNAGPSYHGYGTRF